MNNDTFLAFYGEAKIKHLQTSDHNKDRLMKLAERPVTANSLREFCRYAVEPWRLHFPYRPDDMPPPEGDKAALRRVWDDPEIEIEVISADQQAMLPQESDPWE